MCADETKKGSSPGIMHTTSPLTGTASQLFVPQALADALAQKPTAKPAAKAAEPKAAPAPAKPPQYPGLRPEDARILQVPGFIDEEMCQYICGYIDDAHARNDTMNNHPRTAYHAPLNRQMHELLNKIFLRAMVEKIEPFFHVSIEWWELPQPLRYAAGGKYDPHSDSEFWNSEGGFWEKELDRDISVLLYLNDNFTGGLLNFPEYGLKIHPKPGLLVAFPSHHGYKHGAEPTGEGHRYVLVTWAGIKGLNRVQPEKVSRKTNVRMSEFRKEKDV